MSFKDFVQNKEAHYAEIGRRLTAIVREKQIEIDRGTIRDADFVDRCHEALLRGDRSLLETLDPVQQKAMLGLHNSWVSQ